MQFTVKDFGPVKDAVLTFGDLTVVCGRNNTGKTYLTYSLYNFLSFATDFFDGVRVKLPKQYTDKFVQGGRVEIDGSALIAGYNALFQNGNMRRFREQLQELSAVSNEVVIPASFSFSADIEEVRRRWEDFSTQRLRLRLPGAGVIEATKKGKSGKIEFRLMTSPENADQQPLAQQDAPLQPGVVEQRLQRFLSHLLNRCLPEAFVITCERTGISVFRNEFLIYKELAFEDDDGIGRYRTLRDRFEFKGYPRPIRKDLEFVLRYNEVTSQKSALAQAHPDIIGAFEEIVGGEYGLLENNAVTFKPNGQKAALTLVEGSSSVRSLAELNFYLKHKAREGQLLIFDEPELNLHPEAQRRMARLLVRLVNAGIRVFITTHSDYFIREFNALMMMKQLPDAAFARVGEKNGYTQAELLDVKKARFYTLANGTLMPMEAMDGFGIPVRSFDDTIERFNELYGSIIKEMEHSGDGLA
ncbi:MAG: ATP-binding protein [Candidatus Accumulibacter sp.]|jgi:hypothetical protein|nr:ATP-binding protein [Accumulibacter sp.]